MKSVIVGNGPAAVGAVEAIRLRDAEGSITLFSKEPEHTYSRPLISYLLLAAPTRTACSTAPASFYTGQPGGFPPVVASPRWIPPQKTVTAQDGSRVPYDRLLLATGSQPFIPPVPELTACVIHAFMTLEDSPRPCAATLRTLRVLILGAGLIGLKCLEASAAWCAR
jgi:NAD(P)H-nitrite reductase large subunit